MNAPDITNRFMKRRALYLPLTLCLLSSDVIFDEAELPKAQCL